MAEIPVIVCDDWTDGQVEAFRLMINRSITWADWDLDAFALAFGELKALDTIRDAAITRLLIQTLVVEVYHDIRCSQRAGGDNHASTQVSVMITNRMPAHKLRPQKLQCPFCPAIATRGTGLSAHVRARHPRGYGKWNKNPNRLLEAAAAALPHPEPKRNRRLHSVRSPAPVEVGEAALSAQPIQEQPILLTAPAPQTGENDGHEALSLLQKAYEQLSTRKQSIESELARIEGLRGEHEAVTARVAALDQAMKAFHDQPLRQPKTA